MAATPSPQNRQTEIISHTVELDADDSVGTSEGARVPFSIPLPLDLPPSVDADFGSNTYVLTATVESPPGGKSKSAEVPVRIVHEEVGGATTENAEAAVSEGVCGDRISYAWNADPSPSVGTRFAVDLAILSTNASAVSLLSVQILLQELTSYGPQSRLQTPVMRQWALLKLGDAQNPLEESAIESASQLALQRRRATKEASEKRKRNVEEKDDALQRLAWDLQIPSCSNTPINNSIRHGKSAVDVSHRLVLRVVLRDDAVESALEVKRPIWLRSMFLAQMGSFLPCYCCSMHQDHPYNVESQWRRIASQAPPSSHNRLPDWLTRLWSKDRPEKQDEAHGGMLWFALSSNSSVDSELQASHGQCRGHEAGSIAR